ncbi:hypothetical protein [Tardiphaga alba]|nr:hypothetical protein [Tardiphaga alba]
MRAAAALGRRTEAVKKAARQHGLKLIGTLEAKAAVRKIEESEIR